MLEKIFEKKNFLGLDFPYLKIFCNFVFPCSTPIGFCQRVKPSWSSVELSLIHPEINLKILSQEVKLACTIWFHLHPVYVFETFNLEKFLSCNIFLFFSGDFVKFELDTGVVYLYPDRVAFTKPELEVR